MTTPDHQGEENSLENKCRELAFNVRAFVSESDKKPFSQRVEDTREMANDIRRFVVAASADKDALLRELVADCEIEESHHLALKGVRDAQETFFEKYKDSDPENYRMFREARGVHHEELLRIRRKRAKMLFNALQHAKEAGVE